MRRRERWRKIGMLCREHVASVPETPPTSCNQRSDFKSSDCLALWSEDPKDVGACVEFVDNVWDVTFTSYASTCSSFSNDNVDARFNRIQRLSKIDAGGKCTCFCNVTLRGCFALRPFRSDNMQARKRNTCLRHISSALTFIRILRHIAFILVQLFHHIRFQKSEWMKHLSEDINYSDQSWREASAMLSSAGNTNLSNTSQYILAYTSNMANFGKNQ